MPGDVTIIEAQAQPTVPADADFAVCVIGCASQSPLAAGMISVPYSSPAALASDYGLGDGVDCATQAIQKTTANPSPPPVSIYRTPATTPGVRGVLDTMGVTGTAVITQTATTPKGTYEPLVRVFDDGNNGAGGLIGTEGITLQASPDNGRTWLAPQALGIAFTIAILIGGETTGVEYNLAPATTNAAYVTLAAELRTDTLGHLANAVAHDGADTSAAQVALAASSPPTDVTTSTAVVNLVYAALVAHVPNITAVHDGPDLVAYTALAALSAATTPKEGIDLAIALKAILNAHNGVALAADTDGLMLATATIASPTTYTAAADFLAGGVAAMDAQPRRPTVTTGGGTPADAPATVDFTGFDYAGAAQSELGVVVSQIAGIATATKAFKGTGLSAAFTAADGTDATLAIGFSNGVHNSADVTNIVTSPDPTYGTLFTGDIWGESKTTPPQWTVTDLFDSSDPDNITGAFAAIASFGTPFAIAVITEPIANGDVPTITAALNYLLTKKRKISVLARFRDPLPGETDPQYITAFRTFRASNHDNRISIVVGSGWLTDAFRGYVYFRSGQPAVVARMQSMAAVGGQLGERIAQNPGYVARGVLENFSLVDTTGQPIPQAHDEKVRGGIEGPIFGNGGGITFYYNPLIGVAGTYCNNRAPLMYGSGSQLYTWMDRRVANAITLVAETAAWPSIGGADILNTNPPTPGATLDADIRDGIETSIRKAIADRYALEFQNAQDLNLVTIDPTVTVDLANVALTGTIAAKLYGYTDTITLTFSATRT
jgi:hypothetical protein